MRVIYTPKDEKEIECPNCGSHVNYGEHTFMLSGHIYCDTGDCRDKLVSKLERL